MLIYKIFQLDTNQGFVYLTIAYEIDNGIANDRMHFLARDTAKGHARSMGYTGVTVSHVADAAGPGEIYTHELYRQNGGEHFRVYEHGPINGEK